jgi:Xaa-Pro aminopeptidase
VPHLYFSLDEFAARKSRGLAAMAEAGLDGLLMFKQESMYYLSGYDTDGFVLFQTMLLGADGHLGLVTRSADRVQAAFTSIVEAVRGRMLEAGLAGFCTLVDASDLVRRIRLIKSPAELDCFRKAGALCQKAQDEAIRLSRARAPSKATSAPPCTPRSGRATATRPRMCGRWGAGTPRFSCAARPGPGASALGIRCSTNSPPPIATTMRRSPSPS